MSMISELMDRLRTEAKSMGAYGTDYMATLLMRSADTIEMLSAKGREPKQGEWIPCSERLPNEEEVVLVCMRIESHKAEWEEQRSIEFGRISSDRYDYCETGWEWLNESGADYWQADWNNSILAWMPLPEPFRGEGEEEK